MRDLNALPLAELFAELTADGSLSRVIDAAMEEDLGPPGAAGDVTSRAMIGSSQKGTGRIVARHAGVLAGLAAMPTLIARFEGALTFAPAAEDGQSCQPGAALGTIQGRMRAMLSLERTMLNLLSHLSGIATLTRRYVDAIQGTIAVICDTRKTAPGLRRLEKYAVRCGGGTMHRFGLFDAALIKDNHLAGIDDAAMTQTLNEAAKKARAGKSVRFVEVEVDSLPQLQRILECESGRIDFVLLDNMAPAQLREAVAMRDAAKSVIRLEASGGVDIESVRAIAETGVDRISIGAITHSAPALDIGLDIQ